jgi:hypothetical protein
VRPGICVLWFLVRKRSFSERADERTFEGTVLRTCAPSHTTSDRRARHVFTVPALHGNMATAVDTSDADEACAYCESRIFDHDSTCVRDCDDCGSPTYFSTTPASRRTWPNTTSLRATRVRGAPTRATVADRVCPPETFMLIGDIHQSPGGVTGTHRTTASLRTE